MTDKSFADECRHRFMVATHSEKITPFHKDKRWRFNTESL